MSTRVDIDRWFRDRAKLLHPDVGGSHAAMVALTEERDRRLRSLDAPAHPFSAHEAVAPFTGAVLAWVVVQHPGRYRQAFERPADVAELELRELFTLFLTAYTKPEGEPHV